MFARLPAIQNRICFQRENDSKKQLEKRLISSQKALIDDSPPKTIGLKFLRNPKIKTQIQEQKQIEVERKNRILLNKITDIMHQPYKKSVKCLYKPGQSLNSVARKKQIIQVALQNEQLLLRISQQKSQFSVSKWRSERSLNEKYMANISQSHTFYLSKNNSKLNQLNHKDMVFFDDKYKKNQPNIQGFKNQRNFQNQFQEHQNYNQNDLDFDEFQEDMLDSKDSNIKNIQNNGSENNQNYSLDKFQNQPPVDQNQQNTQIGL